MTFNYSEIAANAIETLTEFGRDVTRRSYTAGTYDYTTGSMPNTTADTTRKGVMFSFGAGKTVERGTLIQAGDQRLLLDATAVVNLQDHFIVGGVEYVVMSIDEVSPAGTVVLYDIHLRK